MAQVPHLPDALQWRPSPVGDPVPQIWQIILELDRRIQMQVVQVVLDSQIAATKVHMDGLTKIQKILSESKIG